jgi:tRNA 2-thiouridine synthesizing protein A
MKESQPEITLDLSGLLCPLPVLKARKKLLAMKGGEVLQVFATDPMAAIDMPHFCMEQGYELLRQDKADGALRFWIRKAP